MTTDAVQEFNEGKVLKKVKRKCSIFLSKNKLTFILAAMILLLRYACDDYIA